MSVTKLAFLERCIPTALKCTTVVIIPKVREKYIGVGLVEVIWEV